MNKFNFRNKKRKEGNILFNDALNTFYSQLYGVKHMVKDHSDSERGHPLLPHTMAFVASVMELFLFPASAPRLVYQRPMYVLSCLMDGAYKRTLAVNRK